MVLDHLRTAGVHQTQKADSIHFTSLQPWPGEYIGAEGRFLEGETERRAGILIGPEFGTLSRMDLVTAAREASEARFDVLIACAFNYDAHASELTKLGPLPILKARMNPDLHMADDLKNTGKGNLFVVFGEPDLIVEPVPDQPDHVRIRINGVDVFDPQTGEIRSGDTEEHRRLVHRHRLQRGEFLRPPRLFPRRQRSLQIAENRARGRDRRGSLGDALPRRLPPVPRARRRAGSR